MTPTPDGITALQKIFVLLAEIRRCINDDHLMAAQRKVFAIEEILKLLPSERRQTTTLQDMAQCVYDTFMRDEAQGYRSKDRQFAIELLGRALKNDDQSRSGSTDPVTPETTQRRDSE